MNTERTFKCRICGGEVTWEKGSSMGECIYCGSKQPIPSNLTAHTQDLYNDAFEYLKKNEYDKAFVVYENIIKENPTDAEAYWGRCLCRYGIEYVDDPNTGKKIPTCHRLQAKSILKDEDYLSALKFAPDEATKSLYTMRATTIDVIQRDIISISQGEEGKYDIFISFKDTDNNENRTKDSHLAEEIYNELTKQGYKVFFSRVTLAQKLGAVYEPYIYAAIHSAKIMIVVGTKPEYIEAAWVRNEWSRYLDLIREGNDKKLIVCFKDMSRKALPEEFVPFQNLDMNERGSMVALIQNIEKIVKPSKKEVKEPTPKKAKKSGCSGCLIPLLIVLGIIGAIVYFAWGPIQNLWQQTQYEMGIVDTPVNGDNDYQKPIDNALYYNDLKYEEHGNTVTIVGYRGTETSVVIPDSIGGKNVTEIAPLAFQNCTSIQSISIPTTVRTIGVGAFVGCNNLIDMTLPFVGKGLGASENYELVLGYIFAKTNSDASKIETSIYQSKTSESDEYTAQLEFPNGTVQKYWYKFAVPKSLKKITITNQNYIPSYAFRYCDLITNVVIDKPIDYIGSYAFQGCSALSNVEYKVNDLSRIQQAAFNACKNLTIITVPEGVTVIEASAFENCISVTEIHLPTTLKTINRRAFKGCSLVENLIIPDNVTTIEDSVLNGCNSLTNLTIPFIGKQKGASGYESVLGFIFGDDTPDDSDLSTKRSTIETGYKTSDSEGYTSQVFSSSNWLQMTKYYHHYAFAIPRSLRAITVTSQTAIPDCAFLNCDLIREITFAKVVEVIGAQAFENCSSLKTVNYAGTQSEWNDIVFGTNWNKNANDFSIVYNKQ